MSERLMKIRALMKQTVAAIPSIQEHVVRTGDPTLLKQAVDRARRLRAMAEAEMSAPQQIPSTVEGEPPPAPNLAALPEQAPGGALGQEGPHPTQNPAPPINPLPEGGDFTLAPPTFDTPVDPRLQEVPGEWAGGSPMGLEPLGPLPKMPIQEWAENFNGKNFLKSLPNVVLNPSPSELASQVGSWFAPKEAIAPPQAPTALPPAVPGNEFVGPRQEDAGPAPAGPGTPSPTNPTKTLKQEVDEIMGAAGINKPSYGFWDVLLAVLGQGPRHTYAQVQGAENTYNAQRLAATQGVLGRQARLAQGIARAGAAGSQTAELALKLAKFKDVVTARPILQDIMTKRTELEALRRQQGQFDSPELERQMYGKEYDLKQLYEKLQALPDAPPAK